MIYLVSFSVKPDFFSEANDNDCSGAGDIGSSKGNDAAFAGNEMSNVGLINNI
jgi:hypothetical protein